MDKKNKGLKSRARNNDAGSQKTYVEYRKLHTRPWIRLWARSIDLLIFGLIVTAITALLFPAIFINLHVVHSLLVLFLWFLVEPIVLSTWGTTIGKLLLNISVLDLKGGKPTFKNAFSRSFWVWCAGYGFGVPFISLFTLYFSYRRLKNNGVTFWDKNNFVVTHGEIGFIRTVLTLSVIFAALSISMWQIHHYQHIPLTPLKHALIIPK